MTFLSKKSHCRYTLTVTTDVRASDDGRLLDPVTTTFKTRDASWRADNPIAADEIFTARLPAHWARGDVKAGLGACLAKRGDFAEAESLILSGIEIVERQWGPEHEITTMARWAAASLYDAWGKPQKAALFPAADRAVHDPGYPRSRTRKICQSRYMALIYRYNVFSGDHVKSVIT